jgi:predicted flap endonuclease-1-like 5' DNA nuclease
MRIVIEIDGGELDAAAVHPSAVTITFPEAPAAEGAAGIRQVVAGEVPEPEPAAEDAGPAPVGGLPWGEPPAFIASAIPAASGTEAQAMDAGPAPTEDLASDESVAPMPPGVPHGVVAEAPAEDAGPAPEARVLREVAEVGGAPGPAVLVDVTGPGAKLVRAGTGGPRAAERGPDDLTAINGIGPKISTILQESGITSFDQLAACDLEILRQLLVDASVAANVDTWPDQARVAATGDLPALQALQATLRSSR